MTNITLNIMEELIVTCECYLSIYLFKRQYCFQYLITELLFLKVIRSLDDQLLNRNELSCVMLLA
jgi:hypothetical protein